MFEFLERFRRSRHQWDAHRAGPVPVRALVPNAMVRVMGVVEENPSPLVSPLLRRSCVVWSARVDEKQYPSNPEDENRPWFKMEINLFRSVPFSILDAEGGRLWIDNGSIDLRHVTMPKVNDAPEVNDDDPRFKAFMNENGLTTTRHMGIAGEHHFYEWALSPGDRVGLYGCASASAEVGSAGYRDAATTRWVLAGTPEAPLLVYALEDA